MPCSSSRLIEALEARIAPAGLTISADARTARWTDVDGDNVILTASRSILDESDFVFLPQAPGQLGRTLAELDLLNDPAGGVSLTFKATRSPALGGDGFIDVGWINAGTSDLATVNVDGDLARLTAGDSNLQTPGLLSVIAFSGGALGTTTQESGSGATPNIEWYVRGRIGTVVVKGELFSALVADSSEEARALGSIGTVNILGSLVGNSIPSGATGNLGSGSIFAAGAIGSIRIAGDLIGGSKDNAGSIISLTSIGSVAVGGSVFGADHNFTGSIFSNGPIASVTVAGNVIGGFSREENSTRIWPDAAGAIGSQKLIGRVTITGNLEGGDGRFAGAIFTTPMMGGKIGPITIGGKLSGSTNVGGEGENATINFNGIYSDSTLGPVRVGAIIGASADSPAHIVALGNANPATPAQALAIASLTVVRGVQNAEILAGYNSGLAALNPDVQIGPIRVGTQWIASSAVAGIDRGASFFFGSSDETITAPVAGFSDRSTIVSRIASFTVGGYVRGWESSTFAIQAQEIGSAKVGPTVLPMRANNGVNPLDDYLIGSLLDTRIREV